MAEKKAKGAEAPKTNGRMIPVPEPLLRGIVEYLSTRPYREVGGGLPALLALLPPAPPAKSAPEPTKTP